MRILVVEDDPTTAKHVAQGLVHEGYEVRTAATGEEALETIRAWPVDLVVLDWMLPRQDGIEVLASMRGQGLRMPVLLLTARDAVTDRVAGLDAGADDYLTKPFAFEELLARIRALMRRTTSGEPTVRTVGDLQVDFVQRRVTRGGEPIELTPREYDLLAYLIVHAGEIVDRDRLARDVWRQPHRATPIDNVIDVHVSRLRRKIDEGRKTRLLHVVRGLGLTLREEGGSP